ALRKGDLDIAITHARQLSQPDLAMEWCREDEFVLYCAASHRLAKRKSITLHDLAQERWAAATSTSGAFGPLLILREAFEERGLPAPRITLVSDLVMFRLRAVARSDLLGVAVKPNILEVATRLRLKILPMRRRDWVRRVAVAYRKDAYLSPAARRFIGILKTVA
ncbi:MAG: LysR family transcriptional regulator substrate-binding protein, partial [Burkholderiales bacterium]